MKDNRNYNVLYLLNSTLQLSGATKSFLLMLKGVMEHGVNPIVVVPDTKGVTTTLRKMGVRIVVIPFRMNTYPPVDCTKDWLLFIPRLIGRLSINTLAISKLRKVFANESLDIIHSNVSVIDIGIRLSKLLRIPHIYHIREYGDRDFGYHHFPCRKRYLSDLRKDSNWSIFITKALKTYYEMDNNPTSYVIYNPIYSSSYALVNNIKKPYFLYAGRLDKGKGVFDLIKAYIIYVTEVSDPLQLYIAGSTDGDGNSIMVDMVREANIGHLVTFLGYRDDVALLMQEAIAIVVPSYYEALGRCLTEAMFNGCLTIGRDTGGIREQYNNGKELLGREIGIRFSTVEELALCMKKVSNMSKCQVSQMTYDAQQVVTNLYSIENNVKEVIQLYDRIKYGNESVLQ